MRQTDLVPLHTLVLNMLVWASVLRSEEMQLGGKQQAFDPTMG